MSDQTYLFSRLIAYNDDDRNRVWMAFGQKQVFGHDDHQASHHMFVSSFSCQVAKWQNWKLGLDCHQEEIFDKSLLDNFITFFLITLGTFQGELENMPDLLMAFPVLFFETLNGTHLFPISFYLHSWWHYNESGF